ERTACTIDSGASESAPTCRPQATTATIQPIKNHLEPNRHTAPRTGWRATIGGAITAPRCLNRKPRLVATAEASARISPKITTRLGRLVVAGTAHDRRGAWMILPGSVGCG